MAGGHSSKFREFLLVDVAVVIDRVHSFLQRRETDRSLESAAQGRLEGPDFIRIGHTFSIYRRFQDRWSGYVLVTGGRTHGAQH